MVRETRYLIVRNLPENCTEQTVIDHFQRYGKIQSVKLQAAKDNDTDSTATVAFNDIKSAAKAHHAKNCIGEVTLRTDYWEGSTATPVLASTPVVGNSTVRSAVYTSATPASSRLASTFSSWTKGPSDEDGSSTHDKGDSSQPPPPGTTTPITASPALDKLSSTAFDLQRGRGRDRIKQKKFGQKFEKCGGSFGRHGTTTSTRSLEAARSQSEAAAAAAAAVASSSAATSSQAAASTSGTSISNGGTAGLNPIIVSDTKEVRELKEGNRESSSRSRPHSVASPSSRNSGIKKSNSHSRSVSRSRSRSRGSRSSSSRSHSSGTSQSTSPHRSHASSTARPQSMVGSSRLVSSEVKEAKRDDNDERRPLGICVMGLPTRSTDSSLRDGLYHEYKKQGKVTTVQICGDGENRCAIISFRKPEDAIKALEASQGKTFFGSQIKVVSHEGVEVDDADRGNDIDSLDEYHVKSTRTLFVGNLEKETTQQDLIDKFQQYGEIIDVDIKRQGATTAFAFVQYADIVSVVSALRAMEGEHIGINKIKLGFGKSMPTDCVWLDCLPSSTSNRTLRSTLGRYGEVIYCYIDRHRNKGLVYFSSYEDAQRCVSDIKARPHVMKKKLQIDFASRECQNDFFNRMERTNQLRANERPDDSNRVHRFRQQRSFDGFQDDGSPSAYGFSRASSSFSARNGRSSSGSTSFRRGRQYADATFPEENHSSSTRRSRRQEEYGQSGQFYNSKGSTDDYDAVLREYGHSQRERRERDLSPRHSADRHGDSQSRQSSRDHSLDRYEKERTVEIYNSRDTSPGSDHNSFHSESRYRSSRDEKYPTRDRYDDAKVEEKDFDHHSRVSRNASPFVHNHSSSHSHDSDYEHRGGSRSQSPPTPIQEDSSIHRIYYNDEYKRSVEVVDDYSSYSHSQKQKDSDDVTLKSKLVSFHPSKLGAEVLKTASKSRKRIHDESALSDVSKLDGKLLRKSEKISLLLTEKGKSSDKEKKHHEASRHVSKVHDLTTGSPGSSGSHVDSENGSVSEGDLHHLHQEKHHILRKLQELNEEGIGTSEPDSPRSVSKIKSVAVKEALRLSGRSHDDRKYDEAGSKSDTHRRQGAKARGVESRRESRSHLTEEMNSTREDKNLIDEKEESVGGNSDLDYSSDFRRMKKRRTESSVDIASVKGKGYRRPSSVDISDEENLDQKSDHGFRMLSGSVVSRVSCDSRVGSKSYGDPSKTVEVSSCDSSDVFKGGLSDKDISVIKQSQTVSKSNTFFPNKDWNVDYGGTVRSPVGCFSPACSDDPTQDSVTSGSLTEKSSEHPPSPPWQHTPTLPLIGKDISYGEYGYFKDFTIPSNLSPDDCLSDDSLEGDLLPTPGEPSVEERIRVIDEMLNMTVSSKSADPSLLVSVLSNKDIANNNDNTALYSKFRIRKREGGLDGGNGSLLTDKKPEPSVIMQQVLSKKSILDQDFKRLEQMCEKYDLSSGREVVKTEVLSPKLVELKGDSFFKPLLSPSLLSPSLSHPVTTSSSMLQPTITTSVAGSTSSFSVTSFSVLTTPVVTTPITTCSIYTLPKLAALDASRRLKVKTSEASLEIPDRHSICTNVLTLKQDIVVSSSSSPPPSVSHPVLTFTNNSLTSSVSQSVTISLPGTLLPETTTTQQSCKFAVSPSSLPPSLLSASASSASTSSASTSCLPSTVHSRTTLQHSVLISPYISSLSSSSSLSISQSTSGAPVAAPFTQGPDKALLTPIVGQEAPRLCSPSFTPENSRTPGTSHMPGSTSPRVASHTTDSDQLQKTNGKTDLKVIVSIDGDSKTDELKANTGISPDIESPVSVQSESSSIASVPLSSIDSKTHLHLDEKTLTIPPVNISQSTGSLHTSDVNFSVKSSDSAKTELVSPVLDMEKTVMEMCEKNQQSMQENVVLFETTKAADILVSKEIKLSSPFTSQTVLSVSSKDHSEKQQSVMDTTCSSSSSNSGKGKLSSSLTLHTTNDIDPTSALKALTSSSAATSSVTSHPVSKSSFDKNDKKVSGKLSSNSSKMSSGAVKSEALFAPDVKMEQIVKASDSRSDSRHQPAKGSASKSSSSDRKSAKSTPKDSHENKDLQSKESEKTDKRLDAEHKNSSVHESSKSRDIHKGKDKRDQSKDSDKSRPKDKEDKKKEEKKTSEKKSEKKLVATKDDKKVEKKVDDRKDKNSEKAKSGQAKHSKSESSGSKQEKKQKEKVKDVKDKSGDKKVTAGLSAKHPATVEVRPDSKSVQKTDSKEATSAKHGTVKDSSIKSEKEGTQKSEAIGKSELKTKHKSEAKVAGKGLGEAKSDSKESLTAAKKPAQVSKSKKEQDKGGSKQNLSKQGHKFLKLKQSDDDKLKEKQKTKEEKDRQKDKEREEKELKEQEEKEKQKEKEEERTEREEREIEEKLKEERERQKEIEREEKEREMKEKEEKEQKEKERQERERQKEKEREEKEKQKEKEREEKEKQKEKEKEERERQKEKDREEKERQKEEKLRQKEREKEEKERQKEREREEKERQKEKEREEKERQKEKEREEKERQKEKEKEEKERQRKEREEKERQKEEREETQRQKEKEREEKERQKKEREEKERQKEKEREEKERQKEKEREQKERQKEKEDKERREREEKDKLRKEKEEKDKQKQKEKDEKEIPKEKKTDKKMKIKEEKPKEKAKKEKAKADIKADKKGKEKKAKEEKPKKDKEDKLKKEKDEKNKKDKEEKANRDKEKAEKERKEKEEKEKKKAAPKKPKRNELAALLEHNDMIQMSFTSMYDRVKTQRNREPDPQHKSEPAPKSSFDKFKQNRKKSGSKVKSSFYTFDTSSGASEGDDLDELSDLSDQDSTLKNDSVSETKPKKSKQVKKRAHVSSSSSSCEEDDDALLSASKPKSQKADKYNAIFSSDSDDDNFQPPSKFKASVNGKFKPVAKRRKTREGSSDSMASRDEFLKPHNLSSITDSLDDMDVSEEDEIKSKRKKTKAKPILSSDHDDRDSSMESVTRKTAKTDLDSSLESVTKTPMKVDKEESPPKKTKPESKKVTKTHDSKVNVKERPKLANDKKKGKNETEKGYNKMEISSKTETVKQKSKVQSEGKLVEKSKVKPEAEKPRPKVKAATKTNVEKPKHKVEAEVTNVEKPKHKVEAEVTNVEKPKHKVEAEVTAEPEKSKLKEDKPREEDKLTTNEAESKSTADKASISESKSTADKVSVSESKSTADKVSIVSESKSIADKINIVSESKSTADKVSVVVSESKSTADKVSVVSESKSTADKVSVVVSESKSTADKLSVISENKSAADKLIVLPENKSAADKLSVLSESKSASDKVSVISESKSAADKVSIVSESKSTADKVSVVSESKSAADKVSIVSESKSAADKLSVVSESKTAADKLSVVSESTLPVGETKNQQEIEAKTDTEKPRSKSEEKQKVKLEVESRSPKEKSIVKIESDNKTETEVLTMEVENLSDTETAKSKVEVGNKSVDKVMQSKPELQIKPDEERPVSFMEVEVKSDDDSLREGRIEPEEKPEDEKSSSKSLSSNDAKSKFPAERKKKNEDKEDSVVKKKKKKKYDPLKEEELVDSLITKVYDKLEREKKEKKKSKLAHFDSEAEDSSAQSEASSKTVSSHTEKVSAKTEEIEPAKPKEEKMDIPKESARLEKHADAKPVAEEVSKVAKKKNRKKKDKKDQKESVDEIDVVMKDQPEKKNKEKPDMEMKQEKMVKSEDRSDDEYLKPPRKKKKKDHDRDADREKEKGVKVGRSPDQKSDTEKSLSVGSEDNMSDDKSSSQFVDEFTSFWGHPKPILIPKRLKDSKKSDDDKVKHKDHKDDLKAGGTDSSDAPSNKDDSRDGSEAKLSPTGDKALETLQNAGQMSDSATEADKTLKMELEMIDDLIVPISEAETTVITEVTSVGTIDSVSSIGASLHMHEESFLEVPATIPDETTIGSSVEIDDDDFPSLIIDEVPESSEKKVTRKDKKLLKKQQVKVLNDHMDEVIASVAMALSSDDEDQTSLHIDSISNDRELLLSDVINQELKYTSKISREPESKSAIITDMLFVDKDVKSKQSGMSSHGSTQKDKDTSGGAKKEQERKKDLKIFGQLDEETKKRDEELLKTLAVLCDPNLDRPVVIDDSKREPSPEAIKKKEEADKKKAEEERIKLEEEKKKAEEEERKKAEEEKKKAEEEKRKKAEEEKRKAEEEAKKAAEEREKAEAERKKAEEEEERRKIEEEKKRIEEEKQRAEEEKKRAEEEKKRAEEEEKRKAEEEKTRREKEEQALREASDEAARAVESLLEFQSGYDQEPVDVDDDLPPLFIEPADKEPPVETVTMSPSGDKNDLVSIFSSPIPDKVTANLDDKLLTANLDDKLLEKKLDEKGPMDQTDNKLDSFSLFATPAQTVTPASVLTSPRRNSAGIKEKTPEPVTSPHRQIQPSPQMHTPHRMQFPPQRPLQSPQGQMQSPQGQMQSPQSQMQSPQSQMQSPQSHMQSPQSHMQSPQSHMQSPQKSAMSPQMDVHSPQPVLHPQRSPFFGKDTAKTDRNFVLANTDASSHSHVDIPHGQQPQRRVSTTLSAQPILDQPLRPIKVSPRRKSQEILPEQLAVSSRRNTIATPEDVSVTHLDRRFPSYMGTDIIFSKERTHSISSLPPPVSISLDHAPHDTNSQSPMQSLNIPSHQDNILLSPKKASPVLQFKERTPDPPVFSSGPSKSALQEPASHFPKGIIQEQIFAQFPKCPSQEPLFYGAKSQASELFRPNKVAGDNVLLHAKSPAPEKPVLQPNRAPDALLMQQKIAGPELVLQHTKGPHHVLDPFPQLEKGVLPPREQMFSPKSQPDNPFSYTDQNIDFLLNSPPRNNLTFPSFPHTTEVNLPPVTKQPDFSQDPLFIAATEAGSRPGDRDPSHIRRTEGFPASFYQEPVPGPKTHQDKVTISLQQHQAAIEDDKKGSRKRKRNNKKATNEDRAAALAELQAIEESVQANVDSIRKALNANQAKAAAEKAHMVGADKKKMLDAYDFEAHIGQDLAGTPGTLTSDGGYSSFGETETKPLRSRNERGRGRGNGTRRGRRGRGAVSSVHEPPDSHQRPDTFSPSQPPLNLPIHAQNPDSLQPQMQQQHPLQQFGLSQQQLPPFQRQTQQGQGNHQPSHAFSQSHPSPVSSENSSSLPGPDWQQKQVSQPYSHSHMAPAQQQMQQQQQLPPVRLPAPKSDVLSSESNKHDLDLSYGESELIINLDDQPSSTEGKENQYSLSSDGEERSLIPSPSAPKSQRSTRARKQPDYKAIASGNIHPPAQLRSSRSGGSPRGLGNGANSPRSMSPRTRSTESMSSSPVVKLEKLEVGRTTRSRRGEIASKGHVKDNDSERVPPSTAVFEEPKARADVEENKSVSKENIYEFVDNEHEQVIETSLRSARARKKRVSDQEFPLQQQQQQQPLPDYMPASPVSGSNSASFGQESRHGFEGHVPEERSTGESPKLPHLSNVDAIIDAVAKGNFGSFDDDPPAPASAPATPAAAPATPAAAPATPAAAPEPDHVPAPPTTRLTRRSTELKKEAEQKAEKTFIIAEPPRFEGREAGRKGPTVPPLRIKVAHGAKVEKSEEKHYVIERAKGPGSTTESEKPPLAFTVKLSDTGTAIIKSAVGTSTTSLASPQLSVPSGKHPLATAGDAFKTDNLQKKDSSIGLFSGLPQNDQHSNEVDTKPSVAVSQAPPWKSMDALADEATVSRPTGALHPKVAAKVQASQESQINIVQAQTSLPQVVQQYPPSSTASLSGLSKSSPVTPATPHGIKHTWSSSLQQDSHHQLVIPEQASAGSYLPSAYHQNLPQMSSPLPRDAQIMQQQQQQPPPASHPEAKLPPNAHSQPVLRSERPGKTGKAGGMDMNPDLPSKLTAETQKHQQSPFTFPPHLPPAHSGQRQFIMPSEQSGHHTPHFPGGSLLKSGSDNRPAKSPSIQSQVASKIGPEVRTQTPPVTPGAMLYAGVVSGQPHSLSPSAASPEGQVIERIQNPIRQPESSQSQSPLSLHLPGSHHPEAVNRFLKDENPEGSGPLGGHAERTPSREIAMYQQILEHQRLQQHLMIAEAARNSDPARNIAAAMRNVIESSRNTPAALEGGRKGSLPTSQAVGHGQPLNLTPQSDLRAGQPDPSRVTPKSTPPAPQSPFSMQYYDRKGESGRLPATVAGSFMQPSPGGHRTDGLAPHLYPELSLANLPHSSYMVGRLPIDPRIYASGQQPPPHLMREGVLSGSFPQAFPPGSRFPGLEHPEGKKNESGHPEQPGPHMLRSPSPIQRQMQADALRQQLTRMPCDLPTRDSPVGFLQRYPVMWQGALALKNDNSYVQMHFIAGNRRLPNQALPQPMQNGALPPLRISQRMRLEHAQLEGVTKRMQCEDHYCILIAVACGRDQIDINQQTRALNEGFITYLLSKQAAGIVNVPLPGSEQVRFVVHIFPPCEFVDNSVAQQGSVVLMEQLREVPHAVVIIATT